MDKQELAQKLIDSGCFIQNEFLQKYIDLIFDNRLDKHIPGFSQCHHGFPKNVSKVMGIEPDNSKSNLFEIKFSVHILAHLYLALCASNLGVRHANVVAYRWMSGGQVVAEAADDMIFDIVVQLQKSYENNVSLCGENHPLFGKSRPDLAQRNREHPPCPCGERNGMFGKRNELSPNYGRHHTADAINKMREMWSYDKHITQQFIQKQCDINKQHAIERTGWYSPSARKKSNQTKAIRGNLNLSIETRQKISAAKSTPIYCITNGVEYRNALDVENKTGLDRKLVSKCCRGEIAFVKQRKKRNPPIGYVYDDTEYVFIFVDGGTNT